MISGSSRRSVGATLIVAGLVASVALGVDRAAAADAGPPGLIAYSVGAILPGPDLDAASQV